MCIACCKQLLAGALGFLLTCIFMPCYIVLAKKLKVAQPIRELGLARHSEKAGTPSAGGIVIIAASLLIAILLNSGPSLQMQGVAAVFLAFAAIGLVDDYKKARLGSGYGISAKQKFTFQLLVCIIGLAILYRFARWDIPPCYVPFSKGRLDLGYLYWPFWIIVICGTANAVNLTDGLDGLVSLPICLTLGVLLAANYTFGGLSQGTELLCDAVIGSCLGFLVYNRHPARVFMGDTGSLAIGALTGVISIILRQEFLLAIAGGIFVVETLSDILQVACFKVSGKRILKMAPLHHHFEKLGFSESKVTYIFWCVSLIFACIGLSAIFR